MKIVWLFLILKQSFSIPSIEFNSLKDLYESTSGSNWEWKPLTTGAIWNFTVDEDGFPYYDPCGGTISQVWQGINCSFPCNSTLDCNILSLSLVGYNLQGSLPQSLSNLSFLETLTLSESFITGSIPSSWSEIITLTSINLHQNSLFGFIPSTFGSQFKSLLRMDLGLNSLSGSIPSSLSSIQSLEHLLIDENYLNGSLPSLSHWPNLVTLSLGDNLLTGSLPSSISSLSNLVYLDIDQNQLSGSIPSTISRLSKLRVLDLDKNQFSGSLPTEIALLPVLNFLYTSQNRLTGSIPPEYGNINGLIWFMSYLNHHSGSIPTTLGKCRFLLEFMVDSNSLRGHLPSSLSNCRGLLRIDFSSNSLSGSLPDAWRQLTVLNQIFIHNNELTGKIPDSYGDLFALNAIDLSNNKFTGTLPSTLFQLHEPLLPLLPHLRTSTCGTSRSSKLRQVLLSETHLWNLKEYNTGDIMKILDEEFYPSQCNKKYQKGGMVAAPDSDLSNRSVNYLRDVLLTNNHFTGCLPSNLCDPPFLRMFFAADNHFHCDLPPLSNCSSLELLWIQNNFITGHPGITVGDGNLTHLESLDLSNNRFSGTIPYEFFSLPMIDSIVITSGCYQGPLSSSICDAIHLTTLTLEGLHAGSECQIPITNPFAVKEVYFTDPFGGEIPSCLWQMSNLESLHLTGNGHHGSLPTMEKINFPKMKTLNLKLNSLSGDSGPLLCLLPNCSLDLSNNKLAYTLHRGEYCQEISSAAITSPSCELKIQNNRISGPLPGYLSQISSLSVLAGAATQYSCSFYARSQLPEQDPDSSSYVCGSQLFDSALVLWALFAIISICYFYSASSTLSSNPSHRTGLFVKEEQRESNVRDWSLWKDPRCEISAGDSNPTLPPSPTIHFLRAMRAVCWTVIWTLVIILVLYIPLIIIVKVLLDKKTEQYQFTWITTLSGMTGFTAALLCLLCGTLVISLLTILLPFSLTNFGRSRGKIPRSKETETRPSQTPSSPSSTTTRGFWSFNWLLYLSILLIDITIVCGIKIGYVYYLLNNTSGLVVTMTIQICFSLLDHLWNLLVSYLLLTSNLFHFHFLYHSSKYSLYLLLLLVNSLLGPALATMVTDEKCFSNAFVGIDSVQSQVTYQYCDYKLSNLDCSRSDSISLTMEFIPPFLYSHECYAAVIKHFLPIIILNQCNSAFLRPLLWHLLSLQKNLSKSQLHFLKSFGFPVALWPNIESDSSQPDLPLRPSSSSSPARITPYNPRKALTEMMHHIAILLTYGLASPIVAILVTCTLIISYRLWNVILCRYYTTTSSPPTFISSSPPATTTPTTATATPTPVAADSTSELEIMEQPRHQLVLVIALAFMFLLFLSIDIAGDESEEAMTDLLLMGGIPCLVWICLLPFLWDRFVVSSSVLHDASLLEENHINL